MSTQARGCILQWDDVDLDSWSSLQGSELHLHFLRTGTAPLARLAARCGTGPWSTIGRTALLQEKGGELEKKSGWRSPSDESETGRG
ncbi:hypothetical protein ColTof4_09774 [Colletotrichum tofieldiae]|nr:hypothetical protein ColTof3_05130 [Colletotrichum tofieldiae]GKT77351.1 hypothetical protein ColTof4_09774 [Colletotrichum tofieldiae]